MIVPGRGGHGWGGVWLRTRVPWEVEAPSAYIHNFPSLATVGRVLLPLCPQTPHAPGLPTLGRAWLLGHPLGPVLPELSLGPAPRMSPVPALRAEQRELRREALCECRLRQGFEKTSKSVLVFKTQTHVREHHCRDLALLSLGPPSKSPFSQVSRAILAQTDACLSFN